MSEKKKIKVLLIEDNPGDARLIREELAGYRIEVAHADRLGGALELLAEGGVDVVLLDLSLPDSQGFETFSTVSAAASGVPILVLSGVDDEDLALRAVRAGAQDYLPKGAVDGRLLSRALSHAIERKEVERELARSNRELRTFRRISEIGLETETLAAAFARMIEEIGGATGFPCTAIELYDPARGVMKIVACQGSPELSGLEVPAERSLSGLVARSGNSVVETNALERPEYSHETLRRQETRTFVCVPMKAEEGVLGTISLASRELMHLDDRFVEWVESLGHLVAAIVERKLKAERLRFQADILASVHDSVMVTDSQGRIVYWNQGSVEVFGYPAEEALGHSPAILYPDPATAAADLAADLESIASLNGKNFPEWKGIRKDGSPVWADVRVTPMLGPDGEVTGFLAISRDVTGRRRAAEAQERLTAILEAAHDFIGIASPDGKVLYMNREGRKMLGLGPDEEVLGGRLDRYHPPSAVRKYFEECFPAALRDGVWTGETSFLDRERREIPVSQVIVSHKGEDGEVLYFSTIARDVTERKQAEEDLRALTETLKALVEASPLAIVAIDRENRVTLWSPAAERTFGWTEEEVLGKPMPIVPEDKLDEHLSLRERVFSGERFTGIESRRRDKAGSPLELRISAAPLRDAHGAIQGVAQFYEDINDWKRAERAIRRLASMPEQSPDPLVELDLAGNALYVNQVARSRFPDLQALGSWHPVLHNVSSILPRFRHGERKSFSFEVTHEEAVYHQMVYYVPDGALVRVFLHDVTEQRRAKELLALRDRLTGLPAS